MKFETKISVDSSGQKFFFQSKFKSDFENCRDLKQMKSSTKFVSWNLFSSPCPFITRLNEKKLWIHSARKKHWRQILRKKLEMKEIKFQITLHSFRHRAWKMRAKSITLDEVDMVRCVSELFALAWVRRGKISDSICKFNRCWNRNFPFSYVSHKITKGKSRWAYLV